MSYYTLTNEILTSLSKLSPKGRKEAFGIIGRYEWDHCSEDPIYWLDYTKHVKTPQHPKGLPYVYTMDPHILYQCRKCGIEVFGDKRGFHLEVTHGEIKNSMKEFKEAYHEMPPVRPFTLFDYMPPIIEQWQKAQFLALEKSRDMTATWLMVVMSTWDVLFHNGRQHIFQSQDAGKTLELVQRSKVVYDNSPAFLKQAIGPIVFGKGTTKSGEFFVVDRKSEILGFPQGPDQIRQFHPSLVFQDEAAFQQLAGEAFAAIKPSIQMGGKFVAISSANRSYFEKICKDRTDE